MSDKPVVHSTRPKLQPETKAGPYVFAAKVDDKNVRITFPDPDEMPWEDAEELLSDIVAPETTSRQALTRWLDDEQYEALKSLNLTFGEMRTLMEKVGEHYKHLLGGPGESDASQG
ncbi:hypothetical protein [Janibacter sp. GS2]|uniref:hypothetical protein n=1 Tax=Janibacter sp. GS2 TaxID=3442646 RepID=UPI003EBC48B2